MSKPHIHAEVIKAWADGAEIEVSYPQSGQLGLVWSEWEPCRWPRWHEEQRYRVKPVPHKFQSLIDACLAGATNIQVLGEDGEWYPLTKDQVEHLQSDWTLRSAHKWQKEMDAAKAGKTIQYKYKNNMWVDWYYAADANVSVWDQCMYEFRIKPETVEQKWYFDSGCHVLNPTNREPNLRLIFEGDELIKAEVLK